MNRNSSGINTDILPLASKMTSTNNPNTNNIVAEASSSSSSSLSKSIRKSLTQSLFDQTQTKNYRYHLLKSEVKKRIHMLKPLVSSGAITSSGVLQVFEQLVADEDETDASLNECEENTAEEEDEQEEICNIINGVNNNTFNNNTIAPTTTTTTSTISPPHSSNTELESSSVKYETLDGDIDDSDMIENMEQDPLEFAQVNMKIISTQSIQRQPSPSPTNNNTSMSHFNISLNPFSHHSYIENEFEEEEEEEEEVKEIEHQSSSTSSSKRSRSRRVKPSHSLKQTSSSLGLTRKNRPPMRKKKAASLSLGKKKQKKVPKDNYTCPLADSTGCKNRFPDRVTARRCALKHGPKGWPYVCRLCKHWWIGRVSSNYYRDLKNFSLHLQHDHKGKTVEEYQELFPHQQFIVDEDWPEGDETLWMLEVNS